ncbi:MAG: biotin/lipoyl-containing protein [Elusimicrobiota bacterium]
MNSYRIGEETFQVELRKAGEGWSLHVDGHEVLPGVAFTRAGGGELAVRAGDSVIRAFVHREGDEFYCHVGGETYRISAFDPMSEAGPGGHGAGEAERILTAPMPGKVVKVLVKAGDEVRRGGKLMVIESMKMETEIVAPADGKVKKVGFAEGGSFKEGELLVEIE